MIPSAEFVEWLSIMSPPRDGVIVVFKIAFDESGTHGCTHLTVSAIVGKPVHWTQVEKDWAPTAAKYAKGYHAADAKDTDNALLASILVRWLYGYTISIAYADFSHATNDVKSEFGSIYVTALRALTLNLKENAERHSVITQAFVLESGHKEEASAHLYLSKLITNRLDFRVYSQTWVGKENLATHPADIAAYVMGSTYTAAPSPLRTEVSKVVTAIELSRESLLEILADAPAVVRDNKKARERRRIERKRLARGED